MAIRLTDLLCFQVIPFFELSEFVHFHFILLRFSCFSTLVHLWAWQEAINHAPEPAKDDVTTAEEEEEEACTREAAVRQTDRYVRPFGLSPH